MGLGDLFKATKNEQLKRENEYLKSKNKSLQNELDTLKKMLFEKEKALNNFKAKEKYDNDNSFLYKDWCENMAFEYADYLYKVFPKEYESYESYKSKSVNRQSNLYKELKEIISEGCFTRSFFQHYPFLKRIWEEENSEYFNRFIEAAESISSYSREDLIVLKKGVKEFEKIKNQFIQEYNNRYFNLDNLEKSRRSEWNTIVQNQKDILDSILKDSSKLFKYVSIVSADYITSEVQKMEAFLRDRDTIVAHEKEVKIRPIRKACQDLVEQAKLAIYQMEYLRELYPNIDEILDTSYLDLPFSMTIDNNVDPVSQYITKQEYVSLNESDRNQLALERYIQSCNKTKWQIGRDYELSIGYYFEKQGFLVDYYGENNKIYDLGRDLIAVRNGKYAIIQCKYWSSIKTIHEKHIFQLYGTMLTFSIENNIDMKNVEGMFVTNIDFSDNSKKFAKMLGIELLSNMPFQEFPRVKCNIADDGEKIYHLPMDQQYDTVKLTKNGETKVFTVEEAEKLGFRRALKWFWN